MGEALDLFDEAIRVERLDRVDDPRVKLAATIVQQTAVSHLVRERCLSGASPGSSPRSAPSSPTALSAGSASSRSWL